MGVGHPMLGTWRARHTTSSYGGPRHPTLSLREVGFVMMRSSNDGYLMLGMREVVFPSRRTLELGGDTLDLEGFVCMMRVQLAVGYPTLEDEMVPDFTLTMGRLGNSTLRSEEYMPHTWSKGSTYLHSHMIFLRFL